MLPGVLMGLVNGFFGSGGGILSVQTMEWDKIPQKKAHATSLLVILPLSLVSGALYALDGRLVWNGNLWALLGGAVAGGILGALLLDKIKTGWLDLIFTLLILISGVRMVFAS